MDDIAIRCAENLCAFANGGCGSNRLQKDRFEAAIKSLGWRGNFADLWIELVQQCKSTTGNNVDAQRVSELNFEELRLFYQSGTYSFSSQIELARDSLLDLSGKTLQTFDTDGDGYIAGEELTSMATAISLSAGLQFSVEDLLRQLDSDADARISLADLKSFILGTSADLNSTSSPPAPLAQTHWSPDMLAKPEDYFVVQAPEGTAHGSIPAASSYRTVEHACTQAHGLPLFSARRTYRLP
jgi:Ca2+-binding EF-hand superfamily protein